MRKAVYLKVTGTVQGVFFRQSTQRKARALGVCGWVRNCEDGTVELCAEGDELAIKEFTDWCHRGPERAVVKNVEEKDAEIKNYIDFVVRR